MLKYYHIIMSTRSLKASYAMMSNKIDAQSAGNSQSGLINSFSNSSHKKVCSSSASISRNKYNAITNNGSVYKSAYGKSVVYKVYDDKNIYAKGPDDSSLVYECNKKTKC
jgi:hypothetical protein